MADLVHLADETNVLTGPSDVVRRLRALADAIESGTEDIAANKAVVVVVRDIDGFQAGIRNIGMTLPECAGVLALGQGLALRDFL